MRTTSPGRKSRRADRASPSVRMSSTAAAPGTATTPPPAGPPVAGGEMRGGRCGEHGTHRQSVPSPCLQPDDPRRLTTRSASCASQHGARAEPPHRQDRSPRARLPAQPTVTHPCRDPRGAHRIGRHHADQTPQRPTPLPRGGPWASTAVEAEGYITDHSSLRKWYYGTRVEGAWELHRRAPRRDGAVGLQDEQLSGCTPRLGRRSGAPSARCGLSATGAALKRLARPGRRSPWPTWSRRRAVVVRRFAAAS